MTIEFPRDIDSKPIQIFTTRRIQTVTAATAWTPSATDRAFSSPVDVDSLIITNASSVAQTTIPLAANVPRGIMPGYTYTFGASGVIEVM